jgi:hypothetical protein
LKSVASLAVLARFDGIFPSPFDIGLSRNDEVKDQEGKHAVNRTESMAASWLQPQIGYQLAHEQFKVPELVGLGIAADQGAFDLLAVSDHFQPWQENEGKPETSGTTLTVTFGNPPVLRRASALTSVSF